MNDLSCPFDPSADFARLAKKVDHVLEAGADIIHLM